MAGEHPEETDPPGETVVAEVDVQVEAAVAGTVAVVVDAAAQAAVDGADAAAGMVAEAVTS